MEHTGLRVIVVDDDPKRGAWVEECLQKAGFSTSSTPANHQSVLRVISEVNPDIILIDMESPGRDILESITIVSSHQPTPVLMFSAEDDPDYINRAVEAGVSAYMIGEVEEQKVMPAINVAMAQFQAFQGLRRQLDDTQSELEDRRLIEKAKLLLMNSRGITEEDAYHELRRLAMECRLRIGEVARRLLEKSR